MNIVPMVYRRLRRNGAEPKYANVGPYGDLAADLAYGGDDPVELKPGDRHAFETGIALEFPVGFCGIIGDRSGLANRQGLHVLAGRIDCGYRGEVKVVLINLGHEDYVVEPGDYIAQLQILPFYQGIFSCVDQFAENTSRGTAGFGSTGR